MSTNEQSDENSFFRGTDLSEFINGPYPNTGTTATEYTATLSNIGLNSRFATSTSTYNPQGPFHIDSNNRTRIRSITSSPRVFGSMYSPPPDLSMQAISELEGVAMSQVSRNIEEHSQNVMNQVANSLSRGMQPNLSSTSQYGPVDMSQVIHEVKKYLKKNIDTKTEFEVDGNNLVVKVSVLLDNEEISSSGDFINLEDLRVDDE